MRLIRGYLGKLQLLSMLCFVLSGLSGLLGSGHAVQAAKDDRTISIYNIHTKKTLTILYKRNGRYIPSAMKKINHQMGDWRRKVSTKMDPKLIDLMWEIHAELGSKKPIYLISGYRSQKTNNMLRKTRGGQAKKSRHILGKAADVHFPDISVRQLRNSAMIKQIGGVGYYPTSAIPFVHLDTGRVRHWPRMGRWELAALFPNGRTRHVPRDGRRITKRDAKIALAKLSAGQRKAVKIALARAKRRTSAPTTRIAALISPSSANNIAKRPMPRSDVAQLSAWNSRNRKPKKPENKLDKKGLLRLASLNTQKHTALPGQNKDDGRVISDANPGLGKWVGAPEYDDDHADELSYSPFPIMPLLKEKSVSYDKDLASLKMPEHDKVVYLFGEPKDMIPLRFRNGLQFAEMLWASDFKGKAVINLMTGKPEYPSHHLDALKAEKKKKSGFGSIFARN